MPSRRNHYFLIAIVAIAFVFAIPKIIEAIPRDVLILIIIFVITPIGIGIGAFRSTKEKERSSIMPKKLKDDPVAVVYDLPDNLHPIEVGALLHRQLDANDLCAVIFGLAIKGYLKIRYFEKDAYDADYEFLKLKRVSDLSHPADIAIFNALFAGGSDKIKLHDLTHINVFLPKIAQTAQFFLAPQPGDIIKEIRKSVWQRMLDQGYLIETAKKKRKRFYKYITWLIIAGIISLFGAIYFYAFLLLTYLSFFAVIVMGGILAYASSFHKEPFVDALTPKGISTVEKILGFKDFLYTTESELKPEEFEKLLPYVIVLSTADEWTEKFGDVREKVNWYEESTSSAGKADLAEDLNELSFAICEAYQTIPVLI